MYVKQIDPSVYSPLARKYGLHISLLERLYHTNAYFDGIGKLCKTMLEENHRTHPTVSICVLMVCDCLIINNNFNRY